jgi:endonuclease YncB( thermonuclease family)
MLLFLLALCGQQALATSELRGHALNILDGSHFLLITPNNQRYRVRLQGIITPNPASSMGRAAKRHLRVLTGAHQLRVIPHKRVRDNVVGQVYLGNRNLALQMVLSGLARSDTAELTPREASLFLEGEKTARHNRVGIWK